MHCKYLRLALFMIQIDHHHHVRFRNPVFKEEDMPSLLPKDVWYALVQDNLEKWRRLQKHE